ncbi:MAG: hypothetical protein CMG62_08565 [Candidatus Marinimicrobia bacterium]|nr:hypothetical protein [Candidatus Neomarinimicrobiota bacterium]
MVIILIIGIISLIFGILLLVSPNSIIKMERQANKIVMTDPFFMKNRVVLGIILLLAAAFMVFQYFKYA